MAATQAVSSTKSPTDGRGQTPPPSAGLDSEIRSPGSNNVESYFNPMKQRTNSIYSLSRASFNHQLSQLTSLSLPDSSSLFQTVAAIPTAPAATTALRNAAKQIQLWIQKAVEVLGGLDADDDVEWAAAGGRDGLEDVDNAIAKFQELVNVYVEAIEHLRKRSDIDDVPKAELKGTLDTLDEVVSAWANVSRLLKEVKRQVELALEWEELWNTVLGEIGMEMENLSQLVFKIEEKRHQGTLANILEAGLGLDIKELETIVEETPAESSPVQKPVGKVSLRKGSPLQSPDQETPITNDAGLLELFARMQPLKAALDFLPMRLSSYRTRAEKILPTACDELDFRKEALQKRYTTLENDGEKIRKELGEDKWVAVFTNAGRQAQKLCESLERGIMKVQEAFDGTAPNIPGTAARRINDYQGKRDNYGPAVQKIIQVISKGINERRTVNGECLRILDDLRIHWRRLDSQLKQVDAALEEYQSGKSPQHMRDSISSVVSSIVSNDVSITESNIDTPGSSPASSVIMAPPPKGKQDPSTPDFGAASRRNSMRSSSGTRPAPSHSATTKTNSTPLSKRLGYTPGASRLSAASPSPAPRPGSRTGATSRTGSTTRAGASTPTTGRREPHPRGGRPVPVAERPRWNAGAKVDYKAFDVRSMPLSSGNPNTRSLNGRPLHRSSAAPSPAPRSSTRTASSSFPHRSPLWRESSASPASGSVRPPLERAASSLAIRSTGRSGAASPSPSPAIRTPLTATNSRPTSLLRAHDRTYTPTTPRQGPVMRVVSTGSAKRSSLLPMLHGGGGLPSVPGSSPLGDESPSARMSLLERPATSLGMAGGGRRGSLLPMPVWDGSK